MINRILRKVWHLVECTGNACRKAIARLRFGPGIRFGPRVVVQSGAAFKCFDGGRIDIGANTFNGRNALVDARGGRIEIGRNSLVYHSCVIVSTASILIGEGALIAENVTIRD